MKKLMFLTLAAILSAALLAGCSKPVDNPVYTSAPNGETIIDEATVMRAAKEHTDLSDKDVQFTKLLLEYDDGKYEYDVEFIYEEFEYEFEINATNGKVKSFDKERRDIDKRPLTVSEASNDLSQDQSDNQYITKDEALAFALSKAELTNTPKENLVNLKIEFEIDDGIAEYEIEFHFENFEYDITINAKNGEIIHFDKELDNR